MAQTKVSLIKEGVVTVDNLHTNHGITTDHIGEGSTRQYFSDSRVQTFLTTNNYITNTDVSSLETVTSLSLSANILSYVDESGNTTNLDLSLYLDDSNLARLVSGTVNSETGIATFTRDDATSFSVDFSAFVGGIDDFVNTASFDTSTGVLTLTRLGGGTVTVDLDNRYLTSYTETDTLATVTGRGATTTSDLETGRLTIANNVSTGGFGSFDDYQIILYKDTSADLSYGLGIESGTLMFHTNGVYKFYANNAVKATISNSGDLTLTGTISASGYNNSNWDTAYGWGNHADGGYQSAATAITTSNISSQSVNYATSATRLYASDSPYTVDGTNPYYMYMNYDGGSYWELKVSPATPGEVRVAYSNNSNQLAGRNLDGTVGIGERLFNNQGRNHDTFVDFNSTAIRSGANYLQQGTNGPTGTTSDQWYGFRLGLGADYGTVTGSGGHYASDLYWGRQSQGGNPYLWSRDMEGGTWGSWRKMYSGYADNSGLLNGWSRAQNGANVVLETASNGYLYINNWIQPALGSGLFYTSGPHFYESGGTMYSSHTLRSGDSLRAPIFYDENNTSYFLNPDTTGVSLKIKGGIVSDASSGSILLEHQVSEANAWIFKENAVNWGLYWFNAGNETDYTFGSYTTVGAELLGFRHGTTTNSINPNAWSGIDTDANATWMLSNYSGDFWSAGTQYSATDMRAPIFYDSNNTGHWLNPAGFSDIKALRIIENWNGSGVHYEQLTVRGTYPSIALRSTQHDNNWLFHHENNLAFYDASGVDSSSWTRRFSFLKSGHLEVPTGSVYANSFIDQNNSSYYVDPSGTSNLNAINDAYGNNYLSRRHSGSDFTQGTLVTTDIDASGFGGSSFVIEVTGKSYSSTPPFSFLAQGYFYNYGIINVSGVNNGDPRLTYIKAMELGGKLAFWWPRVSYWNSFDVLVRDANGATRNRVNGINDSSEPTSATKVTQINLAMSTMYGYNTNAGSLYATTYFDATNTNYFVDPDALTSLRTIGSWRSDSSTWDGEFGGKMQYHSDWWYLQTANGVFVRNASGANNITLSASGQITANADMRSPIYYDLNNTGYFLDLSDVNSALIRGNIRFNDYGAGIVGNYDSHRYQAVFSMGAAYTLPIDGSSPSNLYGLAWSHPNAGGVAGNLNTHGLLAMENGTWLASLCSSTRAAADMRAPIFYDLNDTSNYLDPTGGSNLNALTATRIGVNPSGSSTSRYGVSLYGGYSGGEPTYGLLFTGTSLGSHGAVTGDWATYFTMNNDTSRGWIFRRVGSGNCASISASGVATFDGSVITPFIDIDKTSQYGPGIDLTFSGSNSTGILIRNNTNTTTQAISFFYSSAPQGARGSITVSSTSTAYNTSSDYRLKENLVEITDGIERVKLLQPKRFNFIGDDKTVDGFIAHEAQEVVPEAVTGVKDGLDHEGNPEYQGIDQAKLVPLLTAALQEAIAKIEDLESRLQAIENQ